MSFDSILTIIFKTINKYMKKKMEWASYNENLDSKNEEIVTYVVGVLNGINITNFTSSKYTILVKIGDQSIRV